MIAILSEIRENIWEEITCRRFGEPFAAAFGEVATCHKCLNQHCVHDCLAHTWHGNYRGYFLFAVTSPLSSKLRHNFLHAYSVQGKKEF